jgi:cytochrome c556
MRIGTIALAASALLLATTAASAGGHAAAGRPELAGPDLSGVVKGRQAGMRMSGAIMASIKGAIDRGDDVKTQAFAARSLAGWANALPGMFPEGTNIAPTEVMPAIWTDWAGFKAKSDAYVAATAKLVAATQSGDKAAFAAAWGEVRTTCGACHDAYKQP